MYVDAPDLKASKAKTKKKEESSDEQPAVKIGTHDMFREIRITKNDRVVVVIATSVTLPLQEGQETNDVKEAVRTVKSDWEPHADLYDAMKAIRKHGLAMVEIEDKNFSNYGVMKLKISGDVDMQTSRAQIYLGKKVKRTGKVSIIDCGEVVMYGDSDYKDIDKLTPLIEKIIIEAKAYVGGKGKHPAQIPLF